MNDFLKFFDEIVLRFPMHLHIGYNKTCDWCIYVYKKGCAKDYPGTKAAGDDAIIVNAESCDMELCFAKAQVQLKEWLSKHRGGY